MLVYYSQSGNVNYAAEKIAEALNADRLRIAPEKAYPDKGFMKFFHIMAVHRAAGYLLIKLQMK